MLAGDDGDRVKIYDEDGGAAWDRASTRFVETRTVRSMTARYGKPLRMVFQNTMI